MGDNHDTTSAPPGHHQGTTKAPPGHHPICSAAASGSTRAASDSQFGVWCGARSARMRCYPEAVCKHVPRRGTTKSGGRAVQGPRSLGASSTVWRDPVGVLPPSRLWSPWSLLVIRAGLAPSTTTYHRPPTTHHPPPTTHHHHHHHHHVELDVKRGTPVGMWAHPTCSGQTKHVSTRPLAA